MNDKETTQKKKKKRTGKKVFKTLVFTILFIALITIVAMGGVVLAMIKTAPDLDINAFLKLDEPSILYDNSGKYMDEYITSEKRINISINNVPSILKDAFTSIEDSRFDTHSGIDLKRLGGAIFNDVKIKLKGSDESLQGASTITQQLVKYRMFLEDSIENRTSIKRKVQEISLSLQLEKVLTKPQILEAYMNTIYLGGNANGVEAAAQQYFGKSIGKLSLKQSAFIASAAQNPSLSYSLAYKASKTKAVFSSNRTKAVLETMYKYGKIDKKQLDSAMAEELKFKFSTKNANKMNFEAFSRPVILQVTEDLVKTLNISKEEARSMIMYDGLKITTTMDRALQNKSQTLIDDPIQPGKTNSYDYIFPRDSNLKLKQADIQASCVIMDYHTGEVKTIIAGRGDEGPMSYNRAASNDFLKAPGSSIKPLTVYSPAIDSKIATASTIIEDSPVPEAIGKKYVAPGKASYDPRNSPDKYRGYLTLRDCLKYSVNVAAVKLEDMISLKTGVSYGEKFGLQLDETDKTSMSAMALGQLDGGSYRGTNPLTMAAAYGVFGNNGMRTTPRLYTKVVDRSGKVLLATKFEAKSVLSPQSAYIMYDLLQGPVSPGGTGTNAVFGNMPVRGKTGTSSDSKNLWFVGLTPYYSAAIWIGTDNGSKIQDMGSNTAAALLWGKIMKEAHTTLPVTNVQRPAGISSYSVSKDSGDIPTELTYGDPRGNRAYSELFIDGTQPTTLDSIHVLAKVTRSPSGNYVLISDFTPAEKIETRIFIRRDNPNANLEDSDYVLPTAVDNFSQQIVVPPVTVPPVTEPPVTDPPVTDPPVTDPPVTDPTVTDPPVTTP
ncbi:transglycosylase domain-containing protein [Clostridium bowmanii]|uniref:transglycosylase domain-containing protein n=1 Tax=Clostridium bowmanii TaxID=132925 RepID=UPI001C0ACA65|nr:transglycosylase domain-containing protein [Clostridium bowmanii]MBU3190939.1 transglycosylase domain-containing protein [Clostridium bowmanii]MCA1075442.1 transglycosylase domain-containing protein [Clostridium bowmanii]